MEQRISAETAARRFIDDYFPGCSAAIWAGSAAAGNSFARSDLDLVIVDDTCERPFRQSYIAWGWPIEVFVVTSDACDRLFAANLQAGTAALQRMIAEGRLLKDSGSGAQVIAEAKRQLAAGPLPWTLDEMNRFRYEITELLEDLQEQARPGELAFTALTLARLIPEFVLRTNEYWMGEGKWLYKMLARYDPDFAAKWVAAVHDCFAYQNPGPMTELAEQALSPFGGRLFAGFFQESDC